MQSVAVVIPTFKASRSITDVLARIPDGIARVYVIDDACPEGTADLVEKEVTSPSVKVVRLPKNLGVGGRPRQVTQQHLQRVTTSSSRSTATAKWHLKSCSRLPAP